MVMWAGAWVVLVFFFVVAAAQQFAGSNLLKNSLADSWWLLAKFSSSSGRALNGFSSTCCFTNIFKDNIQSCSISSSTEFPPSHHQASLSHSLWSACSLLCAHFAICCAQCSQNYSKYAIQESCHTDCILVCLRQAILG